MFRSNYRRFSAVALRRATLSLVSACALLSSVACDPDAREDEDAAQEEGGDTGGISAKSVEKKPEPKSKQSAPEKDLPTPQEKADPNPGEAKKGEDCGESKFQADPLPANVMLVLDKSGSMSLDKWKDNGVLKSRWASLHATTKFLLENFGDKVNFGLKLFPSIQKGPGFDISRSCKVDAGIDAACKPNNAKTIMDILPKADAEFMGSTPTVTGLQEAYKHLSSLSDPNPEAAILIVDGRTNCHQSNIELSATAAKAYAEGILVYVVGIDLDAPTLASLAPVAEAGGTKKIYNSSDSKALASSLQKILGGISSCTIPLNSPPPFAEHVGVKLGQTIKVPFIESFTNCQEAAKAGHTRGWIYTSQQGPFKELELCGESCTAFKSEPKVDVSYECPPPV